jgi:hypothetical protein
LIEEYEKKIVPAMDSIQQNEESRINFTKSLFAKFLRNTQNIAKFYLDKTEVRNRLLLKIF